tara:strand:+ start:6385 stop:8064 length:1680 start_codon:yes stop_codon:yes gene_type:complete
MSNNIKIIPGSKQFKGNSDNDNTLQITLESTQVPLIEGDRSVPLDIAVRFNKERQDSDVYRVYGKIEPLLDNPYFGTAPPNASTLFFDLFYLRGANGEPASPVTGWVGYPQIKEFDFIRNDVDESVAHTTNWGVYISYPSKCVENQPMYFQPENGGISMNFMASDGIPFVIKNTNVNGRDLIELHCPVDHGISKGEYIQVNIKNPIYNFPNNSVVFPVYSLGDGTRGSDKNVVSIVVPATVLNPITEGSLGTLRRQTALNNIDAISTYFVVQNEIITRIDDNVMTKCGFAEGVFNEVSQLEEAPNTPDYIERTSTKNAYSQYVYTFTKDVKVNQYKDYLQRPLSKLYVTVFLRNNKGYFDYPPKYGWDWNFPYDFVDSSLSTNTVTDPQPSGPISQLFGNNLTSGIPLKPGDKLRGNFTEYNKSELKERTISEIRHHMNFNPLVFNSNSLGFQYTPHYEVEIRSFSNYIESGDPDKVVDVPDYSTYFTDEKTWKWRDLYEIGFIEGGVGVDYPFLNNAHYPKKDITFVLQRQVLADGIPLSAITSSDSTIENMVVDGCE